ncbi:hypothetical protein, conserved [Eimeria praecox]|uniref:Cwf19-like protein C-terminal domain-containing protein n=1 Tax=Eimeria praecox TaxID=51316 RepID=U6H2D6_9EIME|nr:hypothetical protein, conserved [Eimeria praecox]
MTGLEDEAFECMRNYMKSLVAFFLERGQAVLFIETLYFRKAFSEAEGFWQNHKTYIEAKGRGGVRGTIPKGFPYIYVDFSLEDGLAHVIEDTEEFSASFGHEVFLGMLEKEKTERPFRDIRLYKENVQRLKREYAAFDWVEALQKNTTTTGAP